MMPPCLRGTNLIDARHFHENSYSLASLILVQITISQQKAPKMADSEIDIRKMTDKHSHSFMQWHSTESGQFNQQFSYHLDGQKYICPSNMLSELILAEFTFRTFAQFKEWSNSEFAQKLQLSSQGSYSRSYRTGVSYIIDEEYISVKYSMTETALYLKEASMPECTLRKIYDDLRDESEWYLRKPLVRNCIDRGGCCGRSCGCCEKRAKALPRNGISGHCTPGCLCCNKRRGQGWSDKDLEDIFQAEKEELESSSPFYLQYLASLYFKPLGQAFFNRRASDTSSVTERERGESLGVNPAKRKRVEGVWDQFGDVDGADGEDQSMAAIVQCCTKEKCLIHSRRCE